jgi:antitoxin ParD1/3/4
LEKVEKITVALTEEMADFVRGAVDKGDYASIREAVREWKERRDFLGYDIEELRHAAREGFASGPSARATMTDVTAEARRRYEMSATRET